MARCGPTGSPGDRAGLQIALEGGLPLWQHCASSAEQRSTTASSASASSVQEALDKHHRIWGPVESLYCSSDASSSPSLPDLPDVCFEDESGSDTDTEDGGTCPGEGKIEATTLMLRNLPSRLTKQELMDELPKSKTVPASGVSFLYMPVKPDGLGRGFAFVGFRTSKQATEFWTSFEGHVFVNRKSTKRVAIKEARLQGVEQVFAEFPSLKGSKAFLGFDGL